MKKIRKTKIIATLGPSSTSVEILEEMLRVGMNVARFNFSHGNHKEHKQRIQNLRKASKNCNIPVALLLDTQGPQIRTGNIAEDGTLTLLPHKKIILTTESIPGTEEMLSINYENLPNEVSPGNSILIADGLIELEVEEVQDKHIHCLIKNGGKLGSYKNVNVPDVRLSIPAITEKDIEDIQFAIKEEMDFIAVSFVQTAQDVEAVQHILDQHNSKIRVIAKIETREGLKNISPITKNAYGIMVARGDLGTQIHVEEVPIAQKRIIRTANTVGKVVITATQMLESMVQNPRPTRAEASDVANAILDGTDAVMLSGETASGAHPVLAIKMMHTIAFDIENSLEFREAPKYTFTRAQNTGSALARTAYQLTKDIAASVIFTPTLRGNTPLTLSKFRPGAPIVAITPSDIICRQLLICWGVSPFLTQYKKDDGLLTKAAIDLAIEQELVQPGEYTVTVAGLPLDSPATLNSIRIHFLGKIIQRAADGFGKQARGPIQQISTLEEALDALKENQNAILLTDKIDNNWDIILDRIQGLICRTRIRNLPEISKKFPNLVMICGIHSDMEQLTSGQEVYISGSENIVYTKD